MFKISNAYKIKIDNIFTGCKIMIKTFRLCTLDGTQVEVFVISLALDRQLNGWRQDVVEDTKG